MGLGGLFSKPKAPKISKSEEKIYETQAQIAREQWDHFKTLGMPLQRELVDEARAPLSRAQIASATGRAGADVDASFDAATDRLDMDLRRYGLNPASGRYAGSRRALALGRAGARSRAMTGAHENLINRRDSRRYAALSSLTGIPGQVQAGLGSAAGGYGNIASRRAQASAAHQAGLGQLVGTGLTAAAIAWSDERLKKDIMRVGHLHNDVPIYVFRYKRGHGLPLGWQVGVSAQELAEEIPQAVQRGDNGYLEVDYKMVAEMLNG